MPVHILCTTPRCECVRGPHAGVRGGGPEADRDINSQAAEIDPHWAVDQQRVRTYVSACKNRGLEVRYPLQTDPWNVIAHNIKFQDHGLSFEK